MLISLEVIVDEGFSSRNFNTGFHNVLYSIVSLLLLKNLLVNFCNFGCVVQRHHRVSGVSFLKSLTHRNLCSFCLHLEIPAYY